MKHLPQGGQLVGDHLIHPRVLQPDGVQHARGAFGDARRRIAEAGLPGRSLEGEGSQAVDIVPLGKLIAEAEGSAGRDHRIVQLQAAEITGQSSHRISSLSSTGPSRQMRFAPSFVLQVQPMHAPKPQPILSSKENWPPVLVFSHTARSMGFGPQV